MSRSLRIVGALVVGLVIGLLVAPPADAQASRVRRLGVLSAGPRPTEAEIAKTPFTPFMQALRELGWIDGQNIVVERRYAASPEQVPAMAEELVRMNPDAILVGSAGVAIAVHKLTTTIPIVVAAAGVLEGSGLIVSLSKPGGNVTRLQMFSPEAAGKRVEMLKQIAPALSRLGVLQEYGTGTAQVTPLYRAATDAVGQALRIDRAYVIIERGEFEQAFDSFVAQRVQAVLVYGTPLTFANRKRLADLALRHRLPSAWENREYVEAGGLLSYGASVPTMFRRAASFVDRIFKGASPGDLPVEQPLTFELVINMRTARVLGLTVPPSLLGRADQVID